MVFLHSNDEVELFEFCYQHKIWLDNYSTTIRAIEKYAQKKLKELEKSSINEHSKLTTHTTDYSTL